MNLRIAGALAALAAGVGSVSAQGVPPAAPTTPPPPAPMIGSAMPAPGAAGVLPETPLLPPEAYFGGGNGGQFYAGADYLLWKIRGQPIPQNVTAVPVGLIELVPSQIVTGPGLPTTIDPLSVTPVYVPISVLSNANFGGPTSSDPGFSNGARINLGVWADSARSFGIESSTIILDRVSDNRSIINAGNPDPLALSTGVNNIAIVIPNLGDPIRTDTEITLPRNGISRVAITSSTNLFGTELNLRGVNYVIGSTSFGSMAGFRYINFTDRLSAASSVRLVEPANVTPPPEGIVQGNISRDLTFTTLDNIHVRNNFVGAQIGFDSETQVGAFTFYGRIKFAVGPNFQSSSSSGVTQVINNDPARPTPASITYPGGQLVGVFPSGPTERTRYSFIPELNLKLGYQVAPWARVTVGYDGLYLGHMARAGLSTVNNSINTTVTTGTNVSASNFVQPSFRLADHDAWVQGLSLGFELSF
jgi:hypothetical protein